MERRIRRHQTSYNTEKTLLLFPNNREAKIRLERILIT